MKDESADKNDDTEKTKTTETDKVGQENGKEEEKKVDANNEGVKILMEVFGKDNPDAQFLSLKVKMSK